MAYDSWDAGKFSLSYGDPVFTVGAPVDLWPQGTSRAMIPPAPHRGFDPTADGRFLSLVPAAGSAGDALKVQVALNWTEALKRLVPTR